MDDQQRRVTEDEIRRAVAVGVVDGAKQLMADDDVVDKFWQGGYDRLTGHATSASSQWIGKRIMAAAVTALLVWGVTWLVKNGALK